MPRPRPAYPHRLTPPRALVLALAVASTIGSTSCVPRYSRGPVPIDLARTEVSVSHVAGDGPARLTATIARGSATDPVGQEGRAWLAVQSSAAPGDVTRVTRQSATLQHTCAGPLQGCAARFVQTLTGRALHDDLSTTLAEAHHALGSPGTRDPRWVALEALRAAIYRGHPFGHPPEGRDGALDTIEGHHVRRFFDEQVVRTTLSVQASGSWTTDELAGLARALQQISPSMPPDPTMMAPVPLRRSELYLISTEAAPSALAAGRATHGQPITSGFIEAMAESGLHDQPAMTTDTVHGSTIAVAAAEQQSDLIDVAVALFSNPDVGYVQVVIVGHDVPALFTEFEDRSASIVQGDRRPLIVQIQDNQDLFR